ncbi:MAG: metallophosphoesterase, partial [Armatimonadaceae bacterium]
MAVHVFHTNDFHNRLTETGEQRIREALEAVGDEPFLLLDAGDAIKAGNLGVTPGGEPILRRMTGLGYNAMTIGNRETHPNRTLFGAKVADAGFPILCANMRPQRGGDLPVQSHVVLERAGIRFGIFGITVPMVTERQAVKVAWDMLFDDPIATAQRVCAQLRPECDALVALTHIGHNADCKLADAGLGIDLIISGHTHLVLEKPVLVNSIPIVQTGSHGRYLGYCRWDGTGFEDFR